MHLWPRITLAPCEKHVLLSDINTIELTWSSANAVCFHSSGLRWQNVSHKHHFPDLQLRKQSSTLSATHHVLFMLRAALSRNHFSTTNVVLTGELFLTEEHDKRQLCAFPTFLMHTSTNIWTIWGFWASCPQLLRPCLATVHYISATRDVGRPKAGWYGLNVRQSFQQWNKWPSNGFEQLQ